MKQVKKYVIVDIVTGIVLCALAGFFVFILNKWIGSPQKIRLWLELFTTITGSFYLTWLLSRIKKKNFDDKKEKTEIKRIVLLSVILVIVRLINTALYPLIGKWGEIPAVILSAIIDLFGIVIVYRLLPQDRRPEKNDLDNEKTCEGKRK